MNTNTSLNNAMFNFAFTGVMQPHRQIQDERPKSVMIRLFPPRKPQG